MVVPCMVELRRVVCILLWQNKGSVVEDSDTDSPQDCRIKSSTLTLRNHKKPPQKGGFLWWS